MLNYLYLILLCLFLSILLISVFKFFKERKWELAISSLLYILLTCILTYLVFFTRNALEENEVERLFALIKDGNVLAILTFLLHIGLIVFAVLSYIKVIEINKEKRKPRRKKVI